MIFEKRYQNPESTVDSNVEDLFGKDKKGQKNTNKVVKVAKFEKRNHDTQARDGVSEIAGIWAGTEELEGNKMSEEMKRRDEENRGSRDAKAKALREKRKTKKQTKQDEAKEIVGVKDGSIGWMNPNTPVDTVPKSVFVEATDTAKALEYQHTMAKEAKRLEKLVKNSEGMERQRVTETPKKETSAPMATRVSNESLLEGLHIANWGDRIFEQDLESESKEGEWTEADELKLDLVRMLLRLEDLKDRLEKTNRLQFFQRQKYKKEIEILEGRDGRGGAIEQALYLERKKRTEVEKSKHINMLEQRTF